MRRVFAKILRGQQRYRKLFLLVIFALLLLLINAMWNWKINIDGKRPRNMSDMFSRAQFYNEDTPILEEHERYERAAARQRDAKQRLEEHCKAGFSEVMSEPSISPFFMNRRDRILYCIVPKVATRVLRGYFHTGQISDGNIMERFQDYTRFMFVREPFQRLLSAYRNKFEGPDHYKEKWLIYERKMIRKYRPETPEGGLESGEVVVTFKEFIGYLITNGMEEGFDWHWKPFENICRPCFLTYDFIGRYEHLQDDANFLRKEGNTQIKKPFPPMQESKSDTELVDYYSTIPPEWILRLGEIYEIDFKLFGYPFPGPLESLVKPLK